MRILADENIPADAVEVLRTLGHQVAWVRQESAGDRDDQVLARAQAERRVLVTFDEDFSQRAFRARLPASCGVVFFRFSALSSGHVARLGAAALQSRSDWAGHSSVVEDKCIRMRPFPVFRRYVGSLRK